MQTSNIGQKGVASIRLGGMKVQDLPIAEGAAAREQLPLAVDTERQNLIDDILKGSPRQRADYLLGRIAECEDNIKRVADLRNREHTLINEYTGLIILCKQRKKALERVKTPEEEREVKKNYPPPYNIEKMYQQIEQSKESIERADGVIEIEHASIKELNAVLARCEVRDERLRTLGARIT